MVRDAHFCSPARDGDKNDKNKMTKTKKIIFPLLVALVFFALSFSLTYATGGGGASINGCIMVGGVEVCFGSGGGGFNPNSSLYSGLGLPGGSVIGIMANLLLWILAIFGIIAIIGFVISGIIYLTSAGDENRIATAKKAMTYSIIGVVVGISGWVILRAIFYALQAQSTTY